MGRIHELKYISNTQTERMGRWIIRSGTVLVTCSGTIGRVAIASNAMDGWAASQHILRIAPKINIGHEGYIATFLMSPYGQHQLQSKIYGGVVDELTAEDTARVLIPDLPYSEQEKIGAPAREAYELRDKANTLEDQAIACMEAIISPDEICSRS
jgi:type I restriction enzyme S subunit